MCVGGSVLGNYTVFTNGGRQHGRINVAIPTLHALPPFILIYMHGNNCFIELHELSRPMHADGSLWHLHCCISIFHFLDGVLPELLPLHVE